MSQQKILDEKQGIDYHLFSALQQGKLKKSCLICLPINCDQQNDRKDDNLKRIVDEKVCHYLHLEQNRPISFGLNQYIDIFQT